MDKDTTSLLSTGQHETVERPSYAYVDTLRCLAAFLVILLHCIAGYTGNTALFGTRTWWACDIMNSFVRMGVPLFFMISGFLLLSSKKTDDVSTFYKNRASRLCLPFFFWDILYYFESCALGGQTPSLLSFANELTRQGSKYHLWFIYQIMALYLLMPCSSSKYQTQIYRSPVLINSISFSTSSKSS